MELKKDTFCSLQVCCLSSLACNEVCVPAGRRHNNNVTSVALGVQVIQVAGVFCYVCFFCVFKQESTFTFFRAKI